MAHIDKCMFSQRVSNAAHDDIANIAGMFTASGDPEIVSPGFLCTRSALLDTEAYGSAIPNQNAWAMVEAESTDLATAPIYACNPYGVMEAISGSGNTYKIGQDTLSIDTPAGKLTAWTKIDFFSGDKIYRFGIGNLDAALSTNTFFTITDGMLTPAAAAPSGTVGLPYFELAGTGTLIEGTYAAFDYVDVIAKVAMA